MSLTRALPALMAALLLAGGAGAESAAPATGEDVIVETDIDGARALARQALAVGRPDQAVLIARQILAVVPDDPGAHMLLAAALTRSGAPDQAVPVAKKGFRLAEGKEAKFEGAYLTAEAFAAAGRPWASKLWLRRADLYAPTKTHEAVLGQAYRTVSTQSRLGFAVSLFGGPSDNVNGGSLHDTYWWGPFAIPITEALPGQVYGLAAQMSYTLSPTTRTTLTWSHAEVVLGDRARAIDPVVKAADFRRDQLSLGFDHVWQDEAGRYALLSTGAIARRWSGGDVSADIIRGSLELRRAFAPDWAASAMLQVEAVDIPGTQAPDSVTSRLTLAASHRADWLGAVTLGAGAVEVSSDAAGIAWRGPAMALGWRPPIRSEAFGLMVDLEAERRDYWRTPSFGPDNWLSLSVTAELPSLEVMGFNPTVTVSGARTWSDLVVRDTRELGVSFGISSQF